MADYDKELRNVLKQNSCSPTRQGKGSHEIWYSPITNRHISVNFKVKSRHTANEILKDAGISFKF